MARKYFGSLKSINDVNYRVELYDAPTGSTTAGTELKLAGDGFTLEADGEGSKLYENFIQPSRVTAQFVVNNSTVLDDFLGIATNAEDYWTMVIWKDFNLFFIGKVIADQMQRERAALQGNPIISLTAVDGLNLLDGFNVSEDWFSSVTGAGQKISISSLFKQCLELLDLNTYWSYLGFANYYFYDCRSMYASAAVAKGIQYEYLDLNTFLPDYDPLADVKNIDYITGPYDPINMMTCKKALEQVCKQYGCRLIHDNGAYYLYDATAYAGTTIAYRRFSYTMGYQGIGTLSHRVTIADNTRPQWEAKPVLSYQPALKRLELNTARTNVISCMRSYNGRGVSAIELIQTGMPTGSSPDEVPLSIRTVVKCIVPYTGPNYRYTKAKYELRIYAEDSSGNQKILNADAYWITNPSAPTVVSRDEVQDITNRVTDWLSWEFTINTTSLPAGFDRLTIWMYCELRQQKYTALLGWSNYATVTPEFWGSIQVSINDYSPYQNPDHIYDVVEVFTPKIGASVNSKIESLDLAYYYQNSPFYTGNIYVSNGSTNVIASDYYGGWDSVTHGTPTEILGKYFSALYANFLQTIRGTWIDSGTYSRIKSLYFDNYTWIQNGVSFNPRSETWEGEWLGINPVYSDVTSTGEGLRLSNEQGDIVRDRLNYVQTLVAGIQSGLMKPENGVLNYLINDADGAPTSQPTLNTRWEVMLNYDQASEQVEWHIQEHNQSVTYTAGTYTITNGFELILCDTTDGAITINLPPADESKGKKYYFVKLQTSHSVTISGNGFNINDGTSTTLGNKWSSKTIISDGAQWYIIANV